MAKLTDDEVCELLYAALAISDKLSAEYDHAAFSGSMNDVENFRETVNRLWHRSCGWAEERQSQMRRDLSDAAKWVSAYEMEHGQLKATPPMPDFMIPF